jgi:carboxylesterase type B
VIDGKYLLTSYVDLNATAKGKTTNSVPIMIGVNRDENGVLNNLVDTTNLTTAILDVAKDLKFDNSVTAGLLNRDLFPLGGGSRNLTLRVFNTTTRIYTDNSFHCSDQFTAWAGVKTGALPDVWYYEFNRTYQDPGYDINGVCQPPKTKSHPYGDPSLEYYKCHAGDLPVTFGTFIRSGYKPRDENDIPYVQLIVDYWTSFARNHDPNPSPEYLRKRGYWSTLNQISVSGPWKSVDAGKPEMMELQWNSRMLPFPDAKQCAVIGQPLHFLL